MYRAARDGNIEVVKSTIEQGADVKCHDPGWVSYQLSIFKYISQQ